MPLRTRALSSGQTLHVNDTGQFFAGSDAFVSRMLSNAASRDDVKFLQSRGHRIEADDRLGLASHAFNLSRRLTRAGELDYLILVPTLRCNLSCSYCQVSRAPIAQQGFDWTDDRLAKVLELVDGLQTNRIKIEFQGGEPTLRPDLIEAVIERCNRFENAQFVICTNLHEIGDAQWRLFDRPNLYISTSLDGDLLTHARQRTGKETGQFEGNLRRVIERYGPSKISALPTIDPKTPPEIDSIIETYSSLGLTSIFLRPINYQGFARKRHSDSRDADAGWGNYHRQFVRRLVERNWLDRSQVLEETYFSICLRRVFQPGLERHVDLRNPNPMAVDYLVVDYDGHLYPTDEARMLSRSGIVDLSLGHVGDDWQGDKWEQLNRHSTNQFDEACGRCAYQPFCGRDIVDDLARYGTLEVPRTETAFCQRHLGLFDFIFELIYENDPATRYSLCRWLRLDAETMPIGELVV
jgi:His-Xaa-Ser system radical SAM maturase HxsB